LSFSLFCTALIPVCGEHVELFTGKRPLAFTRLTL
jgi:hypothetical protein